LEEKRNRCFGFYVFFASVSEKGPQVLAGIRLIALYVAWAALDVIMNCRG
jgi:hypothetical protein